MPESQALTPCRKKRGLTFRSGEGEKVRAARKLALHRFGLSARDSSRPDGSARPGWRVRQGFPSRRTFSAACGKRRASPPACHVHRQHRRALSDVTLVDIGELTVRVSAREIFDHAIMRGGGEVKGSEVKSAWATPRSSRPVACAEASMPVPARAGAGRLR